MFIFCGNIFAQKDIDYWNKKLIRAINSKNVKSVVECCNAGADLTLADEDIWRVNPNNISPLIKILGQKKEYKSLIVVWEFFLYVYTTQLGNDIEDIENYFQIVAGLAACYYQINDYESAKVLFTEALSLLTHDDSVEYMDYVELIKNNPVAKAVKIADLK